MSSLLSKHLFFVIPLVLLTCSSGDDDLDPGGGNNQNTSPTNLQVNVTIAGADENNPNGDGSGVFSCVATADNAVEYGFVVGNNGTETKNTTGQFTYTFTTSGLIQFPLFVYAYSSSGDRISKIQNLTINVDNGSGSGNNDVLVWFDEFDGNGSIDTFKWTHETGGGGWGNQEVQYYTNRIDNVYKENGILKIKAIKELYGGRDYTSGRIKTQDKFEFTYGKIEIRAKLPSSAGTWPALWMLGANFNSEGWPQCGEIDIMEQFENKNRVKSTLHWKTSDGQRAEYGQDTYNGTSSSFHVYTTNWTSTSIKSYIDGELYFEMNTTGTEPYYPFNKDFFLIFNVAMGGTNGGEIDPNFTNDTMEVDYIRVYQ